MLIGSMEKLIFKKAKQKQQTYTKQSQYNSRTGRGKILLRKWKHRQYRLILRTFAILIVLDYKRPKQSRRQSVVN